MKTKNNKYHEEKGNKTKIIIDVALQIYYGINYDDVTIAYNQYGKPYIVECDFLHFNVSHSGEWIVCIAYDSPIGIDIQIINKSKKDTFKRIYYPEELLSIYNSVKLNMDEIYCLLWTIKESYLKKIGKGLIDGIDEIKVGTMFPKILLLDRENKVIKDTYIYSFQVDERHFLSICMSDYIENKECFNLIFIE